MWPINIYYTYYYMDNVYTRFCVTLYTYIICVFLWRSNRLRESFSFDENVLQRADIFLYSSLISAIVKTSYTRPTISRPVRCCCCCCCIFIYIYIHIYLFVYKRAVWKIKLLFFYSYYYYVFFFQTRTKTLLCASYHCYRFVFVSLETV